MGERDRHAHRRSETSGRSAVSDDSPSRPRQSACTAPLEALERDFAAIRTGRAATALVERIPVEYYGTQTPLNQLASISVPEAH